MSTEQTFNPKAAITEALAQYAPLEAQIQSALPSVNDYVINGVWDENGYDACRRALREAKRVATAIDAKRKELKAAALEYGRAVDGKAKELTMLCEPTIATLNERIASVDMEREKIKQEKRHKRQQELTAAGFEFVYGAYRVGNQIVHAGAIDTTSDEEWSGIIERGAAAAERVKQEQERAEQERAELERQRREIEQQRAELERQRAELDRVKFTEQAEPAPEPAPAPAPITEAAQHPEPYVAGFTACQSLAIAIVSKGGKRSEIIAALESLEP